SRVWNSIARPDCCWIMPALTWLTPRAARSRICRTFPTSRRGRMRYQRRRHLPTPLRIHQRSREARCSVAPQLPSLGPSPHPFGSLGSLRAGSCRTERGQGGAPAPFGPARPDTLSRDGETLPARAPQIFSLALAPLICAATGGDRIIPSISNAAGRGQLRV